MKAIFTKQSKKQNVKCYFISILFLLTTVFGTPMNSSAQWTTVYSQDLLVLEDIYFVGNQTGYATGNALGSGMLIKTTNGKDFILSHQCLDNALYTVHFCNTEVGYIAGQGGYLGKTTNGGLNWSDMNTGQLFQIFDLYFLNTEIGFGTGSNGIIIKTLDGGNSWVVVHHVSTFNSLFHITSIDNQKIFACGENGLILYSENQGLEWNALDIPVISNIQSLEFTPSSQGFACTAEGEILASHDQGLTWHIINTLIEDIQLNTIFCYNDNCIYAAGDDGVIIRSYDGGTSWALMQTDTEETINSLIYTQGKIGYAAGDEGNILKDEASAGISTYNYNHEIIVYQLKGSPSIRIKNKGSQSIKSITVYNQAGKVLHRSQTIINPNSSTTIDMNDLPTGIYVVAGSIATDQAFARKIRLF